MPRGFELARTFQVIDGKRFNVVRDSFTPSKQKAQARANRIRRQGYQVRVIFKPGDRVSGRRRGYSLVARKAPRRIVRRKRRC